MIDKYIVCISRDHTSGHVASAMSTCLHVGCSNNLGSWHCSIQHSNTSTTCIFDIFEQEIDMVRIKKLKFNYKICSSFYSAYHDIS